MSRIPQQFIDELISRSDIVEVISSRVPIKKAGHEFKACCPFHDEKTPSFTISPAKQFYHCFGCGAHGTAIGFLMDYEKLDFVEAIEELAGRLGMDIPRDDSGPRPSEDLYEVLQRAAGFYQRQLKAHPAAIDYLKRRGVSGEIAAAFGIGYAADDWDTLFKALADAGNERLVGAGLITARDDGSGYYDRFRGRIIFPIRDHRGRTVAFGGRALTDKGPKYLNSPETSVFHKGRELYGLYEARQSRSDLSRLLVVEGYMDVVGLAQHGVRNCVATLGTATTPDHLARLFRICSELVFCFDGDRAGRKAAWRALKVSLAHIRDGRQIRFMFLPEGEDPDSLIRVEGEESFRSRLAKAVPLSEFLLTHLREQVDTDSLDGLARLAELSRPLVAEIPAGVYRDMLTARLADEVKLPAERLARHLPQSEEARSQRKPRPRLARGRPSPVSQAIALLLQHPGAAVGATIPAALRESMTPGLEVLTKLLEELADEPHLTTAGVLERWRSHKYFGRLAELAGIESLINDEQAALELTGLLAQLVRDDKDARRRTLLEIAARQELSESERRELNNLLADRLSNNPSDSGS